MKLQDNSKTNQPSKNHLIRKTIECSLKCYFFWFLKCHDPNLSELNILL